MQTETRRKNDDDDNNNNNNLYEQLRRDGYATLPLVSECDFARTQQLFEQALDSMPEFFEHDEELDGERDRRTEQWVVGSFGRLGNPSSMHMPFVRRMRKLAHALVKEKLFSEAQCGSGRYLAQLPDGVLVRPVGTNLIGKWHQDHTECGREGDEIFGGWLNLNLDPDESQWFVCLPGSHNPDSHTGPGFLLLRDKKQIERCKRKQHKVEVKPGHLLVFYQNILHTMYNSPRAKAKKPLYRLFTAFLLARTPEPLSILSDEKLDPILDEQALFPLKSGQAPPMYSRLHANFHGHLIDNFSCGRIVDVCRDEDTQRVHRVMRSLKSYGLKRYLPYQPSERAVFRPTPLE